MASGGYGTPGRPKRFVDREQLEYLRSLRFTWSEISSLLGASPKTLQRRAKEWNITTYSNISDDALDEIVQQTLSRFPTSGEVMLRGHLNSQQIFVQRERLRKSIARVFGTQPRPPPIKRRVYSVPGPNALWHLDGNHKLIRWGLVVHGGIDGYSRLITFLRCSSNNWAETVLDCFIHATGEYGVPSRVRTDYGGENILVWQFMEENRGTGRGSYIAGKSVHNSRIERLWRDVYQSVSSSYASVFYELESDGALNADNDADLFSLHYIFVPRINESLRTFQAAWNNHSVSTENNMSPLQLYTAYSQGSQLFDETINPEHECYSMDNDVDSNDNHDGDDNDGDDDEFDGGDADNDRVDCNNDVTIVVPQVRIPLSTASLEQLATSINPLHNCEDFGKQLYLDTVHKLFTLMSNDGLIED